MFIVRTLVHTEYENIDMYVSYFTGLLKENEACSYLHARSLTITRIVLIRTCMYIYFTTAYDIAQCTYLKYSVY